MRNCFMLPTALQPQSGPFGVYSGANSSQIAQNGDRNKVFNCVFNCVFNFVFNIGLHFVFNLGSIGPT